MATHLEVVGIIQKAQGDRSLRSFAEHLGVAPSYLSEVYRGRRDVGPRLLKRFGYGRTKTVNVAYYKLAKKEKVA